MRVSTTTLANPDFEDNVGIAAEKYGIFELEREFVCRVGGRQYSFKATEIDDATEARIVVRREEEVFFDFPFFRQADDLWFLVDHVVAIDPYVSSYCWYDGVEDSGCAEKLSDSGRAVSTRSRTTAFERSRVGKSVERLKRDAERN